MINEKNSRTINLIGEENFNKLKNFRVAVFGIGGVGGFALEGLARSGIGEIDIIDSDNIDISNMDIYDIIINNYFSRAGAYCTGAHGKGGWHDEKTARRASFARKPFRTGPACPSLLYRGGRDRPLCRRRQL